MKDFWVKEDGVWHYLQQMEDGRCFQGGVETKFNLNERIANAEEVQYGPITRAKHGMTY